MSQGKIVQIIDAIVDTEFPHDAVPHVYNVLKLDENNLTLEVQQLLKDGMVRTIAMGNSSGLRRDTTVSNIDASIIMPVGKGTLGRIIDVLGIPVDEAGPIDTNKHRAIHQTVPRSDELSAITRPLEIDIKATDLLCPSARGGKVGLLGGIGVGKTVNMMELTNSIAKAHSNLFVLVGVGEHTHEGNDFYHKVRDSSVLDKAVTAYGQMDEPPGSRLHVALTDLTMAEYFHDEKDESDKGRDVLFFVDSIYHYTLAGTEVSTLLDRTPSAVGYQPTSAEEMSRLQERITSTQIGFITSIQTVYVPVDDLTDSSPATTFAYLGATVVLSHDIASLGIYPAVDPPDSASCQLGPMVLGQEHYDVAHDVQSALQEYRELCDIIAILGMDRLSDEDKLAMIRAHRIQRFLSQPFHVAEVLTGPPGKYVSLRDTIVGFKAILSGEYDHLPEQTFYMTSSIDEAVEKAKTVN